MEKQKKKKAKIIRLVIMAVVAVIVIAIAASVAVIDSKTYRADEDAIKAAETKAEGSVKIEKDSHNNLVFTPENTDDVKTGFIFYPGGEVEYTSYENLMVDIAQKGILCILVKMPLSLAILSPNKAAGLTEEHPEIEEWYIGGHSLGGVCSAMYLKNHSDEFKGIILLGSYISTNLSGTNLKALLLYGENDGVMDRAAYETDKKNLPSGYEEIVIPGGCHAWFGNYGEQAGDGSAAITNDEQQEFTADAIEKFIFG